MFGNLFKEAEAVASRSSNLQARIDRLAIRVTQLDSTVEEGKKIHHFYILPNTLKQCSQKWAREFFQGWVDILSHEKLLLHFWTFHAMPKIFAFVRKKIGPLWEQLQSY